MDRLEQTREKVKHDMALNLTELALVSGYGRSSLARMHLPLQHGKISLSDFKRVLRRRQETLGSSPLITNGELRPAADLPLNRVADEFFAPKITMPGR